MRGFGKAITRAPHMLTKRHGLPETADPEYDALHERFDGMDKCATRLRRDAASFRDNVQTMLASSAAFGAAVANFYAPLGKESPTLVSDQPQGKHTLAALPEYDALLAELRDTLAPELELINTKIVAPLKDLEAANAAIKKNITKRDHKRVDLERRIGSYEKAKHKQVRTPKEEQAMLKAQHVYETSKADYDHFNDALKAEWPMYFIMAAKLVVPLAYSLYYMQINIWYLSYHAIAQFAGKNQYRIDSEVGSIEPQYLTALGDVQDKLGQLNIQHPATASALVMERSKMDKGAEIVRERKEAEASRTSWGTIPQKKDSEVKRAPYVIALYDFVPQAEGDLGFKAGDEIEVVSRTDSRQDWWTGTVDGRQGVFPGNYSRDP